MSSTDSSLTLSRRLALCYIYITAGLTDIDEPAGRSSTKLLALEAERDLHDSRDVPGRRLHPDRVRGDQLTPDQHRPEHNLEAVKEVVADNDDGGAARGPAFAGRDSLDAGDGGRRVQAGVQR